MPKYNVSLYREMRLYFKGIEADSPHAAAKIANDKDTSKAELVEDCDSATQSALVDLDGDTEYEHSIMIDYQPAQTMALALLAALRECIDIDRRDIPLSLTTCRHCGRDHGAEPDVISSGLCPADDCPGHKARGLIARATLKPSEPSASTIPAPALPGYYVQIIGHYDAVFKGPYADEQSATAAASAIDRQFQTYVMTDVEMRADFEEFGPIPITQP